MMSGPEPNDLPVTRMLQNVFVAFKSMTSPIRTPDNELTTLVVPLNVPVGINGITALEFGNDGELTNTVAPISTTKLADMFRLRPRL
jgi:hypothetical protein